MIINTKNVTMERKVKPQEPTKVYGTGASKHMKEGKEYTVHAIAAEKLVAEGKASLTPPDSKQSKSAK